MIHTVDITDTTAIVYTVIAVLTVVSVYVYGWARAKRKYVDAMQAAGEDVDNSLKISKHWVEKYKEMQQKYVDVFSKYTALQQEIECHIHETYEEAERPHVEKTWPEDKSAHTHNGWQEFVNEPEETLIEKMKENL